MDNREAIQQVVAKMPGFTFYYGRRSEANYGLEEMQFPAVVLVESDTGAFNLNNTGRVKETTDLFVQFLDLVTMGEHANERHPKVVAMKSAASVFIQILDNEELYDQLPTNMPWFLLVDKYDVNACGIELNIPRIMPLFAEPC